MRRQRDECKGATAADMLPQMPAFSASPARRYYAMRERRRFDVPQMPAHAASGDARYAAVRAAYAAR